MRGFYLRIRALILRSLVPAWHAFAARLGDFFEEAARRARLAWLVVRGGVPLWVEYRDWDKHHDRPAFLDVSDLATEQLLFTVIVWPDLRADRHYSQVLQHARALEIFSRFKEVAPGLAGAVTWEADFSPTWDRERECWVRDDGSAYEGPEVVDQGPDAA